MTASEIEREPKLLPRLTAFRWYAALVVFLFHLAYQIHWRPLNPFSIGPVGVSFFYVLSGFVLTWAYRFDPSPCGSTGAVLRASILRPSPVGSSQPRS